MNIDTKKYLYEVISLITTRSFLGGERYSCLCRMLVAPVCPVSLCRRKLATLLQLLKSIPLPEFN